MSTQLTEVMMSRIREAVATLGDKNTVQIPASDDILLVRVGSPEQQQHDRVGNVLTRISIQGAGEFLVCIS